MVVGRYAELARASLGEPPIADFHEHALIFHVALEQTATLDLPPTMNTFLPSEQARAFDWLKHIAGKLADAKLSLARQCAVFALFCLDTPIADQIRAQTPRGVDLTGVVVLVVPVWRLMAKERATITHMLPFIPT